MRALTIVAALLPLLARAEEESAPPPPADMQSAIFAKLEYDRSYFQRILTLKSQGKTESRLSRAEFDAEVIRATANLPVLDKLFKEQPDYQKGKPLSIPGKEDVHRVYTNLITLLNMLQSSIAGNHQGVVDHGRKVVIKDRRDLGLVRGEDARYYLNLYREYFYLMAVAYFRLNNDSEAVAWMARIEADADLQALKKKITAEGPKTIDTRAARLELLRTRPLAVMPLTSLQPGEETAWMGAGIAEVFTNDLLQYSDLVVVERAHIQKLLKEVVLEEAGFTEQRARNIGEMLGAGTLLVGSFKPGAGEVWISIRLVDAEDGRAVAAAEGTAKADDLFAGARKVLLQLMGEIGWLGEATRSDMMAARAPRAETIRDLLQARLLLASKAEAAKALYAKAIREDPAYAKAFEDLKKEFANVSAAIAVLPFANTSGVQDDLWMVQGVVEALTTDLPRIGFTVVERAQLAALLRDQKLGQILDPGEAKDFGGKIGADFVVLGSLLHQRPTIRVDLRFVDVRTGVVVQSLSAEGQDAEFTKLLVTLSVEIAKRFNEKLSQETIDQLAGKKMSREEFERFAREQLAQETLARKAKPVEVVEEPSRAPFWGATAGAVGGTAIAAVGFLLAAQHGESAAYNEALLKIATRPEDQARINGDLDRDNSANRSWSIVGYAGVGIALASVGYLVFQEIDQPPTTRTTIEPRPLASLSPAVFLDSNAVGLGIGGNF